MKIIKKEKSLYWKLLFINMLPLFFLTAVITAFGVHSFTRAMNREVENGLGIVSAAILSLYDSMYPGEYEVVWKNGVPFIFKGEHSLNQDQEIIDAFRRKNGVEITFFGGDMRAVTTLKDGTGRTLAGTRVNSTVVKDVLETGVGAFYPKVTAGDREFFAYYAPLLNSDGSCVGMLFVAKTTKEVQESIQAVVMPFILVGIFAMLLGVYLTSRFSSNLLHSFKKIEEFLSGVAKGNLECSLDHRVLGREDELGEVARHAVHMQSSLIELIERDTLTGLYNRRSVGKVLNMLHDEKRKYDQDFCIALGDIDDFKHVNDTYGHECGDIVLHNVAAVMKEYMRGKGFVARWGGEEFLIVFKHCALSDTFVMLKELLEEIRGMEILYKGQKVQVTMTLGVSEGTTGDLEAIIRDADGKMYYGKNNGKNQVVV